VTYTRDVRSSRVREDKPAWSEVPLRVRERVETLLGGSVKRATRAYGGYGPSATFRLLLVDGRRIFVKGTYPLPAGSDVRWVLRREAQVYRRLARYMRPWAPAYLGEVDRDGWHLLALEDVAGEMVPPWTTSRTERATISYAEFHRSTYGRRLPPWLSRTQHRQFGIWWRRIAREQQGHARVASLAGRRAREARDWLDRAGPHLRRVESGLARMRPPFALLHFDTRSDNVRLQGRLLRMFDWPFASAGPPEFDLAAFAQAVAADGGPEPERVVEWYEQVMPVRREALTASVVGIAGYFADRAPRPPLIGLPRLRSIQRRQLKASLAWAARLLSLSEPTWLKAVPD
jgi:phosphotransferase family enzyme